MDAGDSLIGDSGTAVNTQGQSSVEVLNLLGYDALALGENDLSKLGPDLILQRAQEADFAILSANVILSASNKLLVDPYLVREFQGVKVAIIGITGPATIPGIHIQDPLEAVQQTISELETADIIILLSHAGTNVNLMILEAMSEISLVISGGGQTMSGGPIVLDDERMVLHADMALPGHAGRRIGIGQWIFAETGHIVKADWKSVALTPDIQDDPHIAEWAQQNP